MSTTVACYLSKHASLLERTDITNPPTRPFCLQNCDGRGGPYPWNTLRVCRSIYMQITRRGESLGSIFIRNHHNRNATEKSFRRQSDSLKTNLTIITYYIYVFLLVSLFYCLPAPGQQVNREFYCELCFS